MKQKTDKTKIKKYLITALVLLALAAVLIICYKSVKPVIKFILDRDRIRDWVSKWGVLSKLAFIAMVIVQVVIAFIPGEPFEIAAGYAFGVIEGTLLCLVGITVGSIIVFLIVRKFGVRVVNLFFSGYESRKLRFLHEKRKLNSLVFILMLIPGTPKDLISYFVGLTEIKFSTWVFIVIIARIPSVITSTLGGSTVSGGNTWLTVIIFAVTIAISAVGLICYNYICKKNENTKSVSEKNSDAADSGK